MAGVRGGAKERAKDGTQSGGKRSVKGEGPRVGSEVG